MTTPVTVHGDAEVWSEVATVLASLPLSYAHGQGAPGGAAVVSGSTGWPTAVARALDLGAVAAIVVHPEPADVDRLRSRGALTALDTRWAANPVIESAAAAFVEALPRASRVESQVHRPVGSSPEAALLEQLTLVRALLGPVSDARLLTCSSHGYAAVGLVADHPVDLSLVCTDAVPESAWVRLLTDDGSVELMIPSGVTAQPATLAVTNPEGTRLSPTRYESGHRATWRRLRALLSSQPTAATPNLATDLDDFASDGEAARTAFLLVEG
ncbi:hypothetical protein [uncultured Friedmanniella sp.]|uniref:hypothetical protein n=1 Tax=uncultured Friedmanniella sp. TaxID=335381 RepID=UPI0035CB78D1